MKYVIKKTDVRVVEEENSRFSEYEFPFTTISLGVSEINGQYPATGYDVDEAVEAYWYVESGTGTVWIAGDEYQIESGDMISIPKGEKYWIRGERLKLVVCSAPNWSSQQHKHIEE